MAPITANNKMVAYAIGAKDYMANLRNPRDIIQYINSNAELSMTYMTTSSIAGYTFYNLPIHSSMNTTNTINKIAYNLWFTDSTSVNDFDCPGNNYTIGCISR
jgi:hypothetical protein